MSFGKCYPHTEKEEQKKPVNISYRNAEKSDAPILAEIYNSSFYTDFIRYGECPAYGKTTQQMEKSIESFPKIIIESDKTPIGVISYENRGNGKYFIGCLCVIPDYQQKGIGSSALKYLFSLYNSWREIRLVTPSDKKENIDFYTRKCGFTIEGYHMDGNVRVADLILRKEP